MRVRRAQRAATAAALLLALLVLAPAAPASAQATCHFAGGFATLRRLLGPSVVGECVEDEHPLADAPEGGTAQQTTRGLLVWRKADNWTAFTNGYSTWINRGDGVFKRLNTQRFGWEAGTTASAAAPRAPRVVAVPETLQHPRYSLYVPDVAVPQGATLDGVLVLHGIDGDGPGLAAAALPWAQARGWVVIAPTITYGDWRDPVVVRDEELRLPDQLAALVLAVRDETHVPVATRVLVFGFSRGAQAATRLTMYHPERVRGVAAFSAGTYTLPAATVPTAAGPALPAPLPYGIADVAQRAGHPIDLAALVQLPWLIGVGANDNRDGDVPRQWDPYEGTNRVQRAQRFAGVLTQLGAHPQVVILPNTDHEVTAAMLDQAFAYFDRVPPAAR